MRFFQLWLLSAVGSFDPMKQGRVWGGVVVEYHNPKPLNFCVVQSLEGLELALIGSALNPKPPEFLAVLCTSEKVGLRNPCSSYMKGPLSSVSGYK